MKFEQKHIDQIRIAFEKMTTMSDFLNLLNQAKLLVYGVGSVPFSMKQITWYANPNLGKRRYKEFVILKKSGAPRSIHAPIKGLKAIQRTLAFIFQCVYEPHKNATGFIRNRSIVENARHHVGSHYVYNIDLKDFFQSIDQARVWKCMQLKPFNLNDSGYNCFSTKEGEVILYQMEGDVFVPVDDIKGAWRRLRKRVNPKKFHFDEDEKQGNMIDLSKLLEEIDEENRRMIAEIKRYLPKAKSIRDQSKELASKGRICNAIAAICCTEMTVERKNEANDWILVKRNVLPQGAPTSPVLTNIVCQKLDFLLSGVAKRFGLKYSRYADDITFSSMHNVYQPESEFMKELHRIIAEQNFHIKESKTRLQKDGYRKEVTGLLVNEKLNVQQRYIKQLRMWLYYWERYGYERAFRFFLQQYLADKGHVKKGKPDMANVISGKLDYLKMVKGADNELYIKLKSRFEKLLEIESLYKTESRLQYLNSILNIAFYNGLAEAMKVYKH